MAARLDSVLDRFRSLTSDEDFLLSFLHHLRYSCGKDSSTATREDKYNCLALAVRDRMVQHWIATQQSYLDHDVKRVYYFSMEYLLGRLLTKNLVNLGILDLVREALQKVDCDLDDLAAVEQDTGLGNGGLGRLAACYMDSLATLGYPAFGYGIRYEFGLFRQEIRNGYQCERPDNWLALGCPWELVRPEHTVIVPLYGRIEHGQDRSGNYNPMWMDWHCVLGEPHDLPMVGFGGRTVNLLRLFRAKASTEFDMQIFNTGDYIEAVRRNVLSENISKVLYPVDAIEAGRELRLTQEYFLVACGMRDILRRYRKNHHTWEEFPDKVAIQMNDTHPALAVAELTRFFVDEAGLAWEKSWDLVNRTMAYTNHTLMPEALERWPVSLVERILPRHMQIICEINRRFLDRVRGQFPGDEGLVQRVSLIEEGPVQQVRMANLAVAGSHAVNGVAELHSRLLREQLFADFHRIWPGKFRNVTNGITPRRWLLCANPALAAAITRRLGSGWITHLEQLDNLRAFAEDREFHDELRRIKEANKARLCAAADLQVSPYMLFDVQAKRLHEYKRQLLCAFHAIDLYLALRDGTAGNRPARACLFAAKAAPGYQAAKLIIKFINSVARVVNADTQTQDLLQVHFVPDYRVSLAETLIPAADLSEQISLAGTEASGTGNMKFALNGALTIGTLDGANIEIRDAVGAENIFIFGLTVEAVADLRRRGYSSQEWFRRNPRLQRIVAAISDNLFSPREPGIFTPILRSLFEGGDPYLIFADYESYAATQRAVDLCYADSYEWYRRVVCNIANMGRFSSDRSVKEYARDIWGLRLIEVPGAPTRE